MAEPSFNEAEQYLLQNWVSAIEVEDSIGEVRQKYQELCERIAETVRANHPELDAEVVEVTNISGTAVRSGVIVLHRESWPREGKYPSGFWVEGLRLEILADVNAPPPMIGLWLQDGDGDSDEGTAQAERKIKEAARETLNADQLKEWKEGDNDWDAVLGKQVASKREILDMLSKGENQRFIDKLAEQFDVLALLIPAIDAAFSK